VFEYRIHDYCCCLSSLQMFTPLHAAAAGGQTTVAKFLLEMNVDVNAVNCNGNTPLHIACLNGMDIIVNDLLAYGASILVTNTKGQVDISDIDYTLRTGRCQ